MSAVAMNLFTAVAESGSRPAPARGAVVGDAATPSRDSGFHRLIADDGKPAAADTAKDKPADARPGDKPARDEAQPAAAGDAGTATPGDGSAVLAWLQQSGLATPAANPAANPAAADAAVKAGDVAAASRQGSGVNGLARLVQPLVPGAARRTADTATASGDAGDGSGGPELPIFRLPEMSSAGLGGKTAGPSLESLLADRNEAAASALAANGAAGGESSASQAAALAALTATATGATTPAPAPVDPSQAGNSTPNAALQTPLSANSPDLPQQLGERVHWLVGAGVQEARLQLHPADLGLVSVQIRVEAGNASVFFGAEHPAARAALEAALPQLREQFAGSGVQLAQAQVSAQSSGDGWNFSGSQDSARSGSGDGGSRAFAGTDGEAEPVAISAPRIVHIGLVDHYA